MRIAMVGAGYVGLVSGACFAEFGVEIRVADTDAAKAAALRQGRVPICEPGFDRLVADNLRESRLSFTTDLVEAVRGAEAVFLAVGTPFRRGDGYTDLSYVFAAAGQVTHAADGPLVLVTKSTVPVGTERRLRRSCARPAPTSPLRWPPTPSSCTRAAPSATSCAPTG
jgi:UDPglucose 6-dehydrogenase